MILQARDESGLVGGDGVAVVAEMERSGRSHSESLALTTSKARPREYSFHVGTFKFCKLMFYSHENGINCQVVFKGL